jgi:hypothetical protein
MLLGPGEVLQCPSCGAKYLKQTLISGNTFGGMFFSDGNHHFPMLPHQPQFICCGNCHAFFWLKDVPSKEHQRNYEPGGYNEDDDLPYVHSPSAAEFEGAIAKNLFRDAEEEEYLRMQLWWHLNNKFRSGQYRIEEELPLSYDENLTKLLVLRQASNPDDFLTLAEINREMGLFEEALELLKGVKEKRLKPVVSQFREKVRKKDRQVFMLT